MAARRAIRVLSNTASHVGLLAALGLACAPLLACRNDFSSFRFAEAEPVKPRAPAPADGSISDSVVTRAAPRADSDATLVLMTEPPGEVAADAAVSDANVSQLRDSSMPVPSPADSAIPAAPDAAHDNDAQLPSDMLLCSEAWNAAQAGAAACRDCACAVCTDPIRACLSGGTEAERALCTALFLCARQHKCHDWDCYCSSSRCYVTPSEPGDGPCATEMGAAAGGHDHVSAVHRDNDPNQPLVKAVRAIGCSVGVPRGSVGGTITGKCVSPCGS